MNDLEVLLRLLLAACLSGCIGYERERHGRAAGLRTHILVCVGSALLMLTGLFLFEAYHSRTSVDPGRIAAQVVSGIGFLGAGTIMRFRASVRGLTTAASLWAVAGIGLAVGCGFYVGAVAATLIMLLVLYWLTKVEWQLVRKDWYRTLVIDTSITTADVLQQIREVLATYQIELRDFVIQKSSASNQFTIELEVKLATRHQDDQVLMDLMRVGGVTGARWQ